MKNSVARKPIEFYVDEYGCHICTSHFINSDGYPILMRRNGSGEVRHMCRVLYEDSFGKIPSGMVTRHKCNNRACINLEHIQLGTQEENVIDSVVSGTHKNPVLCGERNGFAKLTKLDVVRIYTIKSDNPKLSLDKIVEKIGRKVCRATVHLVLRGQIWKDVYAEYYNR